jgi:hypothetical protein
VTAVEHLLLATLGQRLRRRDEPSGDPWPWCRRGVVSGLAWPLAGGPLEVQLEPGVSRSCLPRRWRLDGRELAVSIVRRSRPQTQSWSIFADAGTLSGTVGAIARGRFDPERVFALSCGHVLAAGRTPAMGDGVTIDASSAGTFDGHLIDWEPVLDRNGVHSGLDAAIAGFDADLARSVPPSLLPKSVSLDVAQNMAVTVRADQPKQGLLKTIWSGYVDIPGTASTADYYLENGVGYQATPATAPGDSGAAVWTQDDALLGIHVAAPTGDERFRSNAVYCPIGRIMDWFDITPILRDGSVAAPLAAAPLRGAPTATVAAIPDADPAQVRVAAQTIWGEARGEGDEGMHAVACVIANRRALRWYGARTVAEVCLAPFQFSCWNAGDPNRPKLDAVPDRPDARWPTALKYATQVQNRLIDDITDGATHYYATTLRQAPAWALGHEPCKRIGNQLFFNDIR